MELNAELLLNCVIVDVKDTKMNYSDCIKS